MMDKSQYLVFKNYFKFILCIYISTYFMFRESSHLTTAQSLSTIPRA